MTYVRFTAAVLLVAMGGSGCAGLPSPTATLGAPSAASVRPDGGKKTFFMTGGNGVTTHFEGMLGAKKCSGTATFGGPYLITIRFFSDDAGAVKPTKKDLWVVPLGLDGDCGGIGFTTQIVEDFWHPKGAVHFYKPYTETDFSVYWDAKPGTAAGDQAHLVGDLCDANLGLPKYTYKTNANNYFTMDPVIIKSLKDFNVACNKGAGR